MKLRQLLIRLKLVRGRLYPDKSGEDYVYSRAAIDYFNTKPSFAEQLIRDAAGPRWMPPSEDSAPWS